MSRPWRRCQCVIHKCIYRAKPDSDFCDECEWNPPYCGAMAEYQRAQEQKKRPAVDRKAD
jgi:hypothetical protein